MPYSFDAYLDALPGDWFADDALLRSLLDHYAGSADRERLIDWGPSVAGPLRRLAEESARPENAPRLRHRDAFGRRIDAIELPASTERALAIASGGARLGAVHGDPFVHYAMVYLLAQNGEAGVACSLGCTDGLVRALEALGDRPIHAEVAAAVRRSTSERFVHGAQFVTEIQGGSDVSANETRAIPDGDGYRIRGEKWFCSNINADWFLVTARVTKGGEAGDDPGPGGPPGDHPGDDPGPGGPPRGPPRGPPGGVVDEGPRPLGLFLVPAWAPEPPLRNGYRIERLKDKLGTRELATAEVTFDGALAWPVGPPDRGLPNLLRYVLTPSRFACVLFAAAALRQAERIAGEYAAFREVFGHPIARYPLVARTLDAIRRARAEALGAMFELLRLWRAAEAGDYGGREATDFRILLSLAKPVLTRRATECLHEAMMLLGGNGIEERFSPLPRLARDAVIMETWEGPHNVLVTQALRDAVRFGIDAESFVARVAGHERPDLVAGLRSALAAAAGSDGVGAGTAELASIAPALIAAVGAAALERAAGASPTAPRRRTPR